jgi:hypothetical protein
LELWDEALVLTDPLQMSIGTGTLTVIERDILEN